jgi:DNA adenine methylase
VTSSTDHRPLATDHSAAPPPRRPLLRYHGGKWRLAPWIISHFPDHRVYVEPFGGGASVLLRKTRSYAEIYNDLDGEIVNLFRVARDQGPELRRRIALTPFAREEFESSYIPAPEDPIEQARRTLIRAGMGFGSTGSNAQVKTGFRGSATRSGTTPARDWERQPANLDLVIARLQGVVIEQRDALDIIRYHDAPDTLFYVDPPYALETRSWTHAKDAYKHELDYIQHVHLCELLREVKGQVILSGYDCDLYRNLLTWPYGWTKLERTAHADQAAKRTECLWLRNCAPAQAELAL